MRGRIFAKNTPTFLLFAALYLLAKARAFVVPRRTTHTTIPCRVSTEPSKLSSEIDILIPYKNLDSTDDVEKFIKSDFLSLSPSSLENDIDSDDEAKPVGIWAARAILLAIAVIWGTNFAAVKYLETLCFNPPCVHLPSEAALARFGVASIVSLPLLVGQRKDIILAGLECGAWISLGYITQAAALASIPAGKCAFICSLTVVVVPLISAIFFGKPIKPMNLAAAAVALSGVAILEGMVDTSSIVNGFHSASGGLITEATSSASAFVATSTTKSVAENSNFLQNLSNGLLGVGKGDIIALGQPFGFGLAFMRIEHYVEKFKEEKNQILTLSAAQCVTVGLISLLWVLHDFNFHIPNMEYMLDPHRVAAIMWTGIVTTVVAIYFEGVALQTATATDAALTFSSEPVWASLFGVWLLHEHLNANAYIGGSIILIACILGALSDLPTEDSIEATKEPTLTP